MEKLAPRALIDWEGIHISISYSLILSVSQILAFSNHDYAPALHGGTENPTHWPLWVSKVPDVSQYSVVTHLKFSGISDDKPYYEFTAESHSG